MWCTPRTGVAGRSPTGRRYLALSSARRARTASSSAPSGCGMVLSSRVTTSVVECSTTRHRLDESTDLAVVLDALGGLDAGADVDGEGPAQRPQGGDAGGDVVGGESAGE